MLAASVLDEAFDFLPSLLRPVVVSENFLACINDLRRSQHDVFVRLRWIRVRLNAIIRYLEARIDRLALLTIGLIDEGHRALLAADQPTRAGLLLWHRETAPAALRGWRAVVLLACHVARILPLSEVIPLLVSAESTPVVADDAASGQVDQRTHAATGVCARHTLAVGDDLQVELVAVARETLNGVGHRPVMLFGAAVEVESRRRVIVVAHPGR